jgi:hypothetical protein
MLVLGRSSASGRGATRSADRRSHPLDCSSHSPISPHATKKNPARSTPLAAAAIPACATCARPPQAATVCLGPLTPPSPARTHPAPARAHSTSAWPSLRLRAVITPSPAGHPHGLRAPHSAFARPSTPSSAGHPLALCVPHFASARPSTAARPICSQPSWPQRAPLPPSRCHRVKVSAGQDIISRGRLKTRQQGGPVRWKCMFQVFQTF